MADTVDIPAGATRIQWLYDQEPPVPTPTPVANDLRTPFSVHREVSTEKPLDYHFDVDRAWYMASTAKGNSDQAYFRGQKRIVCKGDDAWLEVIQIAEMSRKNINGQERTLQILTPYGQVVYEETKVMEEYFHNPNLPEQQPWNRKFYRFWFDSTQHPDGWYVARWVGGGDCMLQPFVIQNDPDSWVNPDWMPVSTPSYEYHKDPDKRYHLVWVPSEFDPVAVPLKPRTYVPFNTTVSSSKLARANLCWIPEMDVYYPNMDARGIMGTECKQDYAYLDSYGSNHGVPTSPKLDGPRGVANAGGVYHIRLGRATFADEPGSRPMYKTYGMDGYGCWVMDEDGQKKTLFGLKSKDNMPAYWGRAPEGRREQFEMVGDYSDCPDYTPWGSWGFVFREATLGVDTAHPPIPEEDNRQPHTHAPQMVWANTLRGALQVAEFDAKSHTPVPKMHLVDDTLRNPWTVDEWIGHDKFVVTDRDDNKIWLYDGKTWDKELILEGPPRDTMATLSSKSSGLKVERKASLADLRAQPCVMPEGARIIGDWLYFSSIASACLKRLNLVTGKLEWCTKLSSHTGTYLKFAHLGMCIDGTFGPAHGAFITQWMARNPVCYYPDPTGDPNDENAWPEHGEWAQKWDWYGSPTALLAYDGAVDMRDGRMVLGGAREGIVEFRYAPDGDGIDWGKYNSGRNKYRNLGFHMNYGSGAFTMNKTMVLPWGVHPDIDYFMETNRNGVV